MKALLLGSGTSVPQPYRGSPGLLVYSDDFAILVDPSEGTSQRLAQAGFSLDQITDIVITHFHPDHVTGLIPILFALKNPRYSLERWPILRGPVGLGALYAQLREPFQRWVPEAGAEIELVEGAGPWSKPGITIESTPVRHREESQAYLFRDDTGRRIVFSGDTEDCPEIREFARDVDLLFLECSCHPGESIAGHLNPKAVTEILRESRPSQTVLVHLNPECDDHILEALPEELRPAVSLGRDLNHYRI